jgi:4-aminobutyrate aminotransferase-like enzyme
LNRLAPVRGAAKTMLVTTGAEALENAIKIARVATGRSAIVAFSGAFHGRTMLTMALTGKISPYKKGFGLGVTGDAALSGLKGRPLRTCREDRHHPVRASELHCRA